MATNFLTNLSASWEFEDAASPFLDDTANNNDLTIDGVTPQSTGIFDYCGLWDGVNDQAYILDAAAGDLNITTGSFSFETWVIYDPLTPTTGGFVLSKRDLVTASLYQLDFLDDGAGAAKARFIIRDASSNIAIVASTTAINGPSIFQVVGVCNRTANTLNLYVNATAEGGAVDCSAVGDITNTGNFILGQYNSGTWYKGKIDRTRFWKGRILSATEVTELYNSGSGIAYSALGGGGGGAGHITRDKLATRSVLMLS